MTDPDTSAAQQRLAAARDEARTATIRLARRRGAQLITGPPGRERVPADIEPLGGASAARDLELAARRAARDYVRRAREAGHGWEQIGLALGVAPNADADQAGLTIGEAAYTYAAGSPCTDHAMKYGRSIGWRCRSCDQAITDRGLIAGPADNEPGHTGDCTRLAADVAEWNAALDAELEAGQ